jgi:molybdate transport system ATP-binding protein
MSLDIAISAQFGRFRLDAQLQTQGQVTALFGRSGSGKSSLAKAIAGLIRPQSGHIRLEGEALFDAQARLHVPPWKRQIGYVFQDARLFPHLSVRQNLTYGAGPRSSSLDQTIALLGLEDLLERSPDGLSGGEARRVAIGRAMLSQPRLLILDEPLTGLDGARRSRLLDCLEQIKITGGPKILYISHDLDEIIRLADHVTLMADGKTLTTRPLEQVFEHPEAGLAAGLRVPISILSGIVLDHGEGTTRLLLGSKPEVGQQAIFTLPRLNAKPGQQVRFFIEASDIAIALTNPTDTSVQNRLAMVIDSIEPFGAGTFLVALSGCGYKMQGLVTSQALSDLELKEGLYVTAMIKAVARASLKNSNA